MDGAALKLMVAPSKATDVRVSAAAAIIGAMQLNTVITVLRKLVVLFDLRWPLCPGEAINGVFRSTLVYQGAAPFLSLCIELEYG
jgi:hypothetical protein